MEAFIWGVGAQRRAAKPHTSRGGRSEADRRRCPQMNAGTKERRAQARGRTLGAKTFGYFLSFEKVTRCKSETISGRYRRNGYVHLKENGRLSGRHREQAQLLQTDRHPSHRSFRPATLLDARIFGI